MDFPDKKNSPFFCEGAAEGLPLSPSLLFFPFFCMTANHPFIIPPFGGSPFFCTQVKSVLIFFFLDALSETFFLSFCG